MGAINSNLALQALRATGELLHSRGITTQLTIVIAGGTAGLLAGELHSPRTTDDCDVMWSKPRDQWPAIQSAAQEVAQSLQLPSTWLNHDSAFYEWTLPLGWDDRCEPIGTFGPLHILRLSRFDLIGTKVVGAPTRPQDLEDLEHIQPTAAELDQAAAHIDRLEAEHLDRRSFDDQRAIIDYLRGRL
jgi:hypothetical protein